VVVVVEEIVGWIAAVVITVVDGGIFVAVDGGVVVDGGIAMVFGGIVVVVVDEVGVAIIRVGATIEVVEGVVAVAGVRTGVLGCVTMTAGFCVFVWDLSVLCGLIDIRTDNTIYRK
jgi:hypothetical protein